MSNIQNQPIGPQATDDEGWVTYPKTSEGKPDWDALQDRRQGGPARDFYWSDDERRADQDRRERMIENLRAAEEAGLEKERVKRGLADAHPQSLADPATITLEFAMASDTRTTKLDYLIDPYLPARCVVGFFGRGGTSKSSFLASLAAKISNEHDGSTLWVSVEEPADWVKVRHIKIGGEEGTLAVVKAVASKTDRQGRVVASSFNVYEHLEGAILSAAGQFAGMYHPPKPLRLVVLDTAVGLTTWAKGETPNDDAAVKRLLGYLQALAERHRVTIAIIGHSNKGKHDHFQDTVAGASAWTNSPRLSFVHARDRREEFACVMQVAKSNLTQRFAASYVTVPVHTLHERDEGADSVLCRVEFGEVVWGEEEASELYDEATRKPREDDEDGGGDHRPSVVSQMVNLVSQMVAEAESPVTREQVEARANRGFSRREWTKVDDMLCTASFIHKVAITRGAHNRVLYERMP